MRESRHRVVKYFAQGHSAGRMGISVWAATFQNLLSILRSYCALLPGERLRLLHNDAGCWSWDWDGIWVTLGLQRNCSFPRKCLFLTGRWAFWSTCLPLVSTLASTWDVRAVLSSYSLTSVSELFTKLHFVGRMGQMCQRQDPRLDHDVLFLS